MNLIFRNIMEETGMLSGIAFQKFQKTITGFQPGPKADLCLPRGQLLQHPRPPSLSSCPPLSSPRHDCVSSV